MSEQVTLGLIIAGAVVGAMGSLWLLIRAFRTSILWGVVCLFFFPSFVVIKFKRAWAPLILILLGVSLAVSGPAYNRMFPPAPQTEAAVFHETLTLTGADRKEYAKLETNLYLGLQWANADVTDEDAKVLERQTNLTLLDLTGSQVTDKTLEIVVQNPNLTNLKIARTRITAEAVKRLILDNPESAIQELDVRGLNVPGKLLREWKDKSKNNRKFIN